MFTKNIFTQKDPIADLIRDINEVDYKAKMEALKGNQHKIDKNKNGKIDAQDFKLLKKEEIKKVSDTNPFDYKNYKSQIPTKPGETAGFDSKKISTGTVYMRKPVKDTESMKKEEVEDVAEASFYGNDKMAKAAQDSGDSTATVRMSDAKGDYTATMVRKQGEKDHKEISRVYDKKDVKEDVEELDELSKNTIGSYAKKATRDAVISRKIGADFEHQGKRAKSPGMKAASDELSQKWKEKSWKRRDGVDKAVDRLTKEATFDPLKHINNPSPAVKTAAKDVKRSSYADRAALMKAGGVKDDRGPRGVTQEEVKMNERSLSAAEKDAVEVNVMSMKKNLAGFKSRYGKDAKSVMYATATKQAKKD